MSRRDDIRARVAAANGPEHNHLADDFDYCDECQPTHGAQWELMTRAREDVPRLLAVAEAAAAIEPYCHMWCSSFGLDEHADICDCGMARLRDALAAVEDGEQQ